LVLLLTGTTFLPWGQTIATNNAVVPVRVVRVAPSDLQAAITLNGEVRSTDQIEITPRVSGRIVSLPVEVGQAVEAGQVLAEIDRTALENDLIKARADLLAEQAALAKLQASPRPEDIAEVEANVRVAEMRLQELNEGPSAIDIDQARQRVSQAEYSRMQRASQLAAGKEQARIALEQAVASLQAAQARYGADKLIYDEATRTGKDPTVPSCPETNKDCDALTDAKLRSYKAAFESAEASLRSAEASVRAREIEYEDAKRQEVAGVRIAASQVLDAQAELEKAGMGPDASEIAEAEANLEAARASLARAQVGPLEEDLRAQQAQIQSAESAVRMAEANLREAVVVAPFAGVITQRNASVGSTAGSSTVIVTLVSLRTEVRLNADDTQVTQIEPGQAVEVRLNGLPDTVFTGRVASISPTASATNRTFTVTVTLDSSDNRLKPGMLVRGDVAAISKQGVITVPESALITRVTDTYVFVVASDKAQRRAVTLGVRGGGQVEVLSGLQEGDQVIVEGQTNLNEGDAVTVQG
jgi:HlyD family secretion protein